MLKKIKPAFVLVLLVGVLGGGYAVFADMEPDGTPGSNNDPLVTRSFVEKYVTQYISEFLIDKPAGGTGWQVVELKNGQVFEGLAGTEFIVRSGKAVVVDPTPDGIPDVTVGTSVAAGSMAAVNHMFIVPRSDGRGVKANGSVWLMYKGEYSIK